MLKFAEPPATDVTRHGTTGVIGARTVVFVAVLAGVKESEGAAGGGAAATWVRTPISSAGTGPLESREGPRLGEPRKPSRLASCPRPRGVQCTDGGSFVADPGGITVTGGGALCLIPALASPSEVRLRRRRSTGVAIAEGLGAAENKQIPCSAGAWLVVS